MLTTLRIKNLALVTDLTLELQHGYNVITGETGAGKSILIGALNLVLGQRADRTLIRSGAESCSVEAVFDIASLTAELAPLLDENGIEPCEDHQLVLKRAFTNTGANRQFINGSPATLNLLASIGERLVDIHGPHEHQSLLYPARQLAILDAFGGLEAHREAFAGLVRRRAEIEAEKTALIVDEHTYAQQLDLLAFQVNEITAATLIPDEDAQVEQHFQRASNAARLIQLGQAALDLLNENENSLLTQAGAVGRTLQELNRLDPSAAPVLELHRQAIASLHELQSQLAVYLDKVDVDPERLAQLEERLNLLQTLKRKYGSSLPQVIAFGEEARRKLEALQQRDQELARLNIELQKLETAVRQAGQSLSARRLKVLPQLSRAVSRQLAELGFKQSRFDITLTSSDLPSLSQGSLANTPKPNPMSAHGCDTIEFQFAPNPGEPPRPLRAIASSGELARVMLALKTVLAAQDQVPVLVFDEIDANVGGETAGALAEKMRAIARKRQVLCITHLPQVAASASAHFLASKEVKAGRTISEIALLDKSSRIAELTRMLGGETEAARRHAQALFERGQTEVNAAVRKRPPHRSAPPRVFWSDPLQQ
ncbi:MAG TPA: DNA repair protein RecN [Verrucomicrobiae bacterium]|nr:DNA repair protein RecN [Verrucomicrobiae bacterium]